MKPYHYIAIILLISITSCRSKKEFSEETNETKIDTVYVNQKEKDTIVIREKVEVTKPVYFETEIPCDEDQKGEVSSGSNFTQYEIKNGKIILKTKLDSLTSFWQSHYQVKYKKDSIDIRKELEQKYKSQQEIIKYVYPWWVWLLGFGILVFAALWLRQKFMIV